MNIHSKWLLVVSILLFCGCSKQIDQSMALGKYSANHKYGIDTLVINSDGTYNYYFRSVDGAELTNTNRWHFENQNNEPRITFDKFIFGIPGYGSKAPGFWDVRVEKTGNTLRLCIDKDLNYYYEKLSQ